MAYEIVGNTLVIDADDGDVTVAAIDVRLFGGHAIVLLPAGPATDDEAHKAAIQGYLQGPPDGTPMVMVRLSENMLSQLERIIQYVRRETAARLESN